MTPLERRVAELLAEAPPITPEQRAAALRLLTLPKKTAARATHAPAA